MPCHAFSIQLFCTAILYWINTVLIIIPQDSITRGWAAQRIGGYINITCRTLWITSRDAALVGLATWGFTTTTNTNNNNNRKNAWSVASPITAILNSHIQLIYASRADIMSISDVIVKIYSHGNYVWTEWLWKLAYIWFRISFFVTKMGLFATKYNV